jgi:regulator of protease activity HflC (stomatin/prohibitin superfamily)
VDPSRAIVAVEDFRRATYQISQTSLRSVLGQSELDELLTHRDAINQKLQQIIDEQTEPWGIKVSIVEVKDVELPEQMKRAMAIQAQAERERRAKIINAEGEYAASERLKSAANIMAQAPAALQLRYLQTLTEIAAEKNSTIIFPLPMELMRAFMGMTAILPDSPPTSPAEPAPPAPAAQPTEGEA